MIDSNQTRFHLVLGETDWMRCTTDSGANPFIPANGAPFYWDKSTSHVSLGRRINIFHSAPGNQPPNISQRRGAAQDRFGNFYWIAESGNEILVNSVGSGATSHFWSSSDEMPQHCGAKGQFGECEAQPSSPLSFSGLTITTEHFLVAGVVDPAGVIIFDLFRGGPPRRLLWPSTIPFYPFDMAAAPDGGLWILDRNDRRLWLLDRTFAVVRLNQSEIALTAQDIFTRADGQPQPTQAIDTFPAGFSLDSASPLQGIDAIAITVLGDGSVLLLESDSHAQFSLVYRMRDGVQIGSPVSLSGVTGMLEPEDQSDFSLLGFDFAFLANELTPQGWRSNVLYVVGQNGDQAWAFLVDYSTDLFALTPVPEYYPMRLYAGRGLITGQTHIYYDSQWQWVPITIQKRPHYIDEAALLTWEFDGKQPDCVWHKLMLDAALPADASVTIQSRANNDLNFLQAQGWNDEPGPILHANGSDIPWTQLPSDLASWELLFQCATGRYLQLRITLSGNGKTTPRIRAVRAYYPRFSYLHHYLPGVYSENEQSSWFLDRFLANFEGFYTSIEDRIATMQALLDPGSAPSDTLNWIANWFGVALDPSWNDAKRRLFLSNAAAFFEARGTASGLLMALRLTLEDCADQGIFRSSANERTGLCLVEAFRKRRLPPGLLEKGESETGLPIKPRTAVWTPALGADELNQRYSTSLQSTGIPYPIYLSSSDSLYSHWAAFSTTNIGLVPGQPDSVSDLWEIFLRDRYSSVSQLNQAYNSNYTSFSDVPFPISLPRLSQPLWDWYQFQGVLLIQASAHRFMLFLPMVPGDAQNVMAHRNKLRLARRVIDLEKPAHTDYEIQFYWAFFRLGEARLGTDTVLDYGSRAPQLMLPALLGDTYLGSVYLTKQPQERPFLRQGSC